ncbi:MAG: Hint domain-containing protein [Conexivisphaerales archaeon]
MSDSNEIHQFTASGYSSLYFNNQYSVDNDGSQDTCFGPGFTITITTTSTTSQTVSVSFDGGQYVSVGTLDIGVSSSTSNTNSFQYTFPSYFGNWSVDSLNGQSGSTEGALAFSYVPCVGGGGGCVLENTMILLANGTSIPVKLLTRGDMVRAYSFTTKQMITTQVISNTARQVNQVLNINNGELLVSGINDQPMYVQLPNGTFEQIELGQITTGMRLFSPMSNTWFLVSNLRLINGSFTVYDLRTVAGNYIANGILVKTK